MTVSPNGPAHAIEAFASGESRSPPAIQMDFSQLEEVLGVKANLLISKQKFSQRSTLATIIHNNRSLIWSKRNSMLKSL